MASQSYVDKIKSTPAGDRGMRQEAFILKVTEQVLRTMSDQGVSREEMAERTLIPLPLFNQMLDGEAEMTLRDLSDIYAALGTTEVCVITGLDHVEMTLPEVSVAETLRKLLASDGSGYVDVRWSAAGPKESQ